MHFKVMPLDGNMEHGTLSLFKSLMEKMLSFHIVALVRTKILNLWARMNKLYNL
jgi:hypothetical protein